MYRHSWFGDNPNDSPANDHIFGQSCFRLFVVSNVYSSSYLCLFELYKGVMSRYCEGLVSCNSWQTLNSDEWMLMRMALIFCQVFFGHIQITYTVRYLPSHTSSCVTRPWRDGVPDSERCYGQPYSLTCLHRYRRSAPPFSELLALVQSMIYVTPPLIPNLYPRNIDWWG